MDEVFAWLVSIVIWRWKVFWSPVVPGIVTVICLPGEDSHELHKEVMIADINFCREITIRDEHKPIDKAMNQTVAYQI